MFDFIISFLEFEKYLFSGLFNLLDNTFIGTLLAGLVISYVGIGLYAKKISINEKFEVKKELKKQLTDVYIVILNASVNAILFSQKKPMVLSTDELMQLSRDIDAKIIHIKTNLKDLQGSDQLSYSLNLISDKIHFLISRPKGSIIQSEQVNFFRRETEFIYKFIQNIDTL